MKTTSHSLPHLIFDLSEVLLPGLFGIEKELSIQFGRSENEILQAMEAPPYHGLGKRFHRWMSGDMNFKDFTTHLVLALNLHPSTGRIFENLCRKFLGPPYPHTYPLLEKLKEKYRLFLISDHMDPFVEELEAEHRFLHFFEQRIWSCQIGATKSEGLPFEILMKQASLFPKDCLFIDDHPPNLKVADGFGLNTFHFVGSDSVDALMMKIG